MNAYYGVPIVTADARVRRSLRFSFIEGAFASVMTGFTQEYFTPLLLFLGGAVRQVGFLNALPNLTAALLQVFSPDITERLGSRRRTVRIFVFLQAMMLVPVAALAWNRHGSPETLLWCAVGFTACGSLANPAWGSMMADLIPSAQRGTYFGWRNRTLGVATVAAMLSAGMLLKWFKCFDVAAGFSVLFFAAGVMRLCSWFFLGKMYEPELRPGREDRFTLWQFVRRLRSSNFAKFVLFVSLMSFSANTASPFFSVLMLRELKFDYLLFSAITMTATLTIFVSIARWGRLADRVGNVRVIRFTAPLIGVIPLLWVICRHPVYLFGAQMVSGFVWAGFNLCTANFIYDAVTPQKRTRCIAYFNLCNGVALSLGALLGGYLLPHLPVLFGHRFLSLCCLSAALRLSVGMYVPQLLREVRTVERMHSDQVFFSMVSMRPMMGVERKTIRF